MIRRLRAIACCNRSRLPLFAILVALWAASGSPGFAAPAAAQAVTAPAGLVQMDHISLQIVGKGSPVILIPGLSTPRAVWEGVAPELARKHAVYLVQLNGFGGDDPRANLKPGILPGAVADLHRLVATHKLKNAAVVGHSLGGLIGMLLARDHPGDVGRLLVVDALPWFGTVFAPGFDFANAEPMAARMREQLVSLYGVIPASMAEAVGMRNALKPASRAQVGAWSLAADMRVSGQAIYEDLLTNLSPDLPRIATPITVLVPWSQQGGGEAVLDVYRKEYAGAPHARFVGIGDSGHFVMLDQPDAFAKALSALLNG